MSQHHRSTAVFRFTASILLLAGSMGVQAGAVCNQTTINRVGNMEGVSAPGSGATGYQLRLTCGDAPPAWDGERSFWIGSGLGDSGYATALTAVSLGKQVKVELESAEANSLITRLELLP